MEDGECQLGGYVNTLLGYKTRLHFLSRSKDKVDVVMFGESKCRVRSIFEVEPLRIDCAGADIFDHPFMSLYTL